MKPKNAIRVLVLFCVCFFGAAAVYGLSLDDLVGSHAAMALRNDEKLTSVQFGSPRPSLAPVHGNLLRLLEGVRSSLDPGIMAESLTIYSKPAKGAWTAEEQRSLFNSVTALSSLEGLQYYSATRNAWRTFYESSRVIDGPSTKAVLPDPVFYSVPDTLTLFARQKDLTFGDNIYRYDYRVFPDALVFVQENLTPMKAGIITAVGSNRLRSVLAIIDAGDCLLVYTVSMAKATALPGIKDRIGNSFANRADAVVGWFVGQADKVYKN